MLTFQKAIFAALLLLACLYLLHSTSSTPIAGRKRAVIGVDSSVGGKDATSAVPTNAPKGSSAQTVQGDSLSEQTQTVLKNEDKKEKAPPSPSQVTNKRLTPAEIQELTTHPLRQRLKEVFQYVPQSKFPAYIWQTWKVTPASGSFGEDNRPREASWTEFHPTFVHQVIDDNTTLPLLKYLYAPFPEVLEAYMSLPPSLPVLRADFFRYLILLARGGVYSDIDTYVIQPVSRWIPAEWDVSNIGLVVGIEADVADRPDWHDWYSRAVQFCQWTILSKRGHPVLRDIVANITEEVLAMKKRHADTLVEVAEADEDSSAVEKLRPEDLDKSVVELTGPAVWTDSVFRHLNSDEIWGSDYKDHPTLESVDFSGLRAQKRVGDVVVLPITSFSPGVGQMGAEDESDPMAFVKHDFDGTWKPEDEQMKIINPPSASPEPENVEIESSKDSEGEPPAPEAASTPEA
ncbi:alpha 1,6 mannosyltransferase [Ascosphaera apis ARSEF 7405]|uniref:Alpha 1,6 mannosyltransferase n=1 Tax=Ascosphaera apis ARSEF 7405 TaxID=392613 RepID=A0A166NVF0_9EURO|nr:alpha 1,6 mannosyltransferase [Ascosphaera apis ARSEF 7405]